MRLHQAIHIDILPYDCLWYDEPNAVAHAIGYAMHSSRSHDAVIRVYDAAGNVIETRERPSIPMIAAALNVAPQRRR